MVPDHTPQGNVSNRRQRSKPGADKETRNAEVAGTLRSTYELLEQYAPPWYTEEHQKRVESALNSRRTDPVSTVVELYDLIEEYAPVWYPKELHEKMEHILGRLKES